MSNTIFSFNVAGQTLNHCVLDTERNAPVPQTETVTGAYLCLQCHEACIAIYSSMENQKLSHWVGISVLSMFFCLLIYTLTGEFTSEDHSASCAHIWKLPVTSTLCPSRCLRLHDVWTRRCFRHFDVISGKWCGHDHLQTSFWNINHHHLSHYSSPGEVSRAGL